ncbi:MAG TPA: hypothetical protein VLH41_06410 [Thermoanaerobaculia bacterium]|nr:hypothetical protein [Thermoanaerobaculia bacterium]
MILIVKRPAYPAGGWGYLGEEAGDEWEAPGTVRSGEGCIAASSPRATDPNGAENPGAGMRGIRDDRPRMMSHAP